jgi:hypothetical protein
MGWSIIKTFWTPVLDEGERSASHPLLQSRERERLSGPQSRREYHGKENISYTYWRSNLGFPAHCLFVMKTIMGTITYRRSTIDVIKVVEGCLYLRLPVHGSLT